LAFREASHTTRWVEQALAEGEFRPQEQSLAADGRGPATVIVEVNNRRIPVRVWGDELPAPPPPPAEGHASHARGAGSIVAPMQGTILQVLVEEGQEVKGGDVVLILEAMKMENHIAATQDGVVSHVAVRAGDVVQMGKVLVEIG
jgi:acetyl-CoA/propionyl-CoA carboxylase biotin carboxyl carrier protein